MSGAWFVVERGRHGDDEHVGGLDLRRGAQHSARDDALDQAVEIDFLDMDLARIDRVDDVLRDVDAQHRAPVRAITAAVGRPI